MRHAMKRKEETGSLRDLNEEKHATRQMTKDCPIRKTHVRSQTALPSLPRCPPRTDGLHTPKCFRAFALRFASGLTPPPLESRCGAASVGNTSTS